jgi:hypothetical protein
VKKGWKQIITKGRLKHIHLVLILGISLFIPLFLAYSVYIDLSGAVPIFSDMSFEDTEGEDLSTCQNESKGLMPMVSSYVLLSSAHFGNKKLSLFSLPLASYTQITPVLRCQTNHPSLFFLRLVFIRSTRSNLRVNERDHRCLFLKLLISRTGGNSGFKG